MGTRAGELQGLQCARVCVSDAISSKYTLCPRGFNHVDTFRIYEALMAGVIVVTCDTSSATQLCKRMTSQCCTRLTRIPSQAASRCCHVTTISPHSSAPIIRFPGAAVARACFRFVRRSSRHRARSLEEDEWNDVSQLLQVLVAFSRVFLLQALTCGLTPD